MSRFLHSQARIFKVYTEAFAGFNYIQMCTEEALTGFSHTPGPDSLTTTSLSQGCVLGAAFGCGEDKQGTHSKDMGGRRGPPIDRLQISGQVVVTS